MPYRRRATRGRYYQRRPARPSMWVRNAETNPTRLDIDNILVIDLLAPLHTQDAQLKVLAGGYENPPSATGKTVVRILGNVKFRWNATAAVGPSNDDGCSIGIFKQTWTNTQAQVTYDLEGQPAGTRYEVDPRESANPTDWMYWNWVYPQMPGAFRPPAAPAGVDGAGGGDGPGDYYLTVPLDIRSKRALSELADTVLFCARPSGSGTAGVEAITVTTSVLLR